MRLPVAAKTAFDTAAAVTAVPGSPIPPGASRLRTRCTSMAGASLIRMTRTSWKLDCSTRPFLSVTPPHRAPLIPKIPALDLGLHGVRVHDRPAIDCADDPVDADLARLRHRDLGHLRQITAPFAEKHRDAAAPAFGQRLSPSGRLRGGVQDCRRARRFAEEGPAKGDGILLRGCGELVDDTEAALPVAS